MNVRQLKTALKSLEQMLSGMNAKDAAKGIAKFSELFDGFEDLTVSAFVSKAKKGLHDKTATTSTSRAQKIKEDVVEAYLNDLKNAEGSSDSFFDVLSKLAKDRKARKIETIAIAQRRLSTTASFKTKKAAIEDIKTKFITDSHDSANASLLEKMGWSK